MVYFDFAYALPIKVAFVFPKFDNVFIIAADKNGAHDVPTNPPSGEPHFIVHKPYLITQINTFMIDTFSS